MAQVTSNTSKLKVQGLSSQQILFPHFRNKAKPAHRKKVSDYTPFLTNLNFNKSTLHLGNEVVRGKGYMLFAGRRSQSSGHMLASGKIRPKSQCSRDRVSTPQISNSKSTLQKVTYIHLVNGSNPQHEDLSAGFQLMKHLSKLRRREATDYKWLSEDFQPVPKVRKKLTINLVLPAGGNMTEESVEEEESGVGNKSFDVCILRPKTRVFSSMMSTRDSVRKQIDAVTVLNSSPAIHTVHPSIQFRPFRSSKPEEDLRKSIYRVRSPRF